jgi:hypothetical protein
MCCDEPEVDRLTPPVAAMLDEYRALNAERRYDWGDEIEGVARGQAYARWFGSQLLEAVFAGQAHTWPELVRRCLADPLPAGLIVASLDTAGVALRAGAPPYAIAGGAVDVAVLLDSHLDDATRIDIDGSPRWIDADGVDLITFTVPAGSTVSVGPATVRTGESAPPARLRLRARGLSRWSVTDDRGGAWFPEGRLCKWDFHGRPMFHGDDLILDVPAVPLTITCARGIEFDSVATTVTPIAGAMTEVELEPPRLYDPAARGWYGGDLHVHMNYSGDLVCSPHDAACMQLGEGLHLMNLVAGNVGHARVYDREAFESSVGRNLPWSTDERVARFGVEYRNDLLGHFHGLGLTGRPARYFTGHSRSDHPVDWPANATACKEFQELGATVGYAHPVFSPLSDGSPAEAFRSPRSVEARELVVDAALGLVDSVDLIGPNDVEGTALLYHHLLNCGLRLAATAGTDVWLSYSRGPLISNPPGWARVYADLRGASLSVPAFQEAIRSGRTLATNGPWIELTVDGGGPGDVVAVAPGQMVSVSARTEGLGVESIELIGPDGVVARGQVEEYGTSTIDATVSAVDSLWLCAVARGRRHPSVLGPTVFAHTSPIYVEVAERPVRRAASARWLLDWLDRLEAMLRSEGQFADDAQRDEVIAVIERARHYYRARTA